MDKLTAVEGGGRKQSAWITGARVVTALVSMAVPIVLVRVLDQSEFGLYKELFLIAATALPIVDLGVPASLYYFVPRSKRVGQEFHVQSLVLLSVAGVVGGSLVLAGSSLLERFMGAGLGPYLGWLALYVAFSVPGSLLSVAPMVDRRSRLAAAALSTFGVGKSLLLVAVAVWTGSLELIVVAACVAAGLKWAGSLAYVRWRGSTYLGKGTGLALWRRLTDMQLSYALPFYGAALIGMLREKLHRYYVAVLFSSAQFAIYAVATINIPILDRFSRTIGEVLVIETSGDMARDELASVRQTWWRATGVLALVMVPCVANGIVFAPELFRVVFGADYVDAAPLFRVFVTVLLLEVVPGSSLLRSGADLRTNAVADAASLVAVLAVLVGLAGALGTMAAVLSLVAGRLTYNLVAARRVAERLELGVGDFLDWAAVAEMAAGSLVIALAVRALCLALHLPAAVVFLGGGFLSVAGYSAYVWLRSLVPSEEEQLIREVAAAAFGRSRG